MGIKNHADFGSVRITSATDTNAIVSGSGLLINIAVLGGTAGDITIYDALTATGTPIAVIASAGYVQGQNYQLLTKLDVGLSITTAAASDIFVSFKS